MEREKIKKLLSACEARSNSVQEDNINKFANELSDEYLKKYEKSFSKEQFYAMSELIDAKIKRHTLISTQFIVEILSALDVDEQKPS